MAVITICEYSEMPLIESSMKPPIAKEPCIQTKTYAIGGTTAQSDAFDDRTAYVWIDVDVATRFEVGSNPTALAANTGTKAGSKRLPADGVYFTAVVKGASHKVAFITG